MKDEQRKRIEELRWMHERNAKKSQLEQKLFELLPQGTFSVLSHQDSDRIQLLGHDWPHNKWEDQLYIQTPIEDTMTISALIQRFVHTNLKSISLVFFMRFNFGLISVKNEQLLNHWAEFIELDGDEIFCYLPERPEFICIEKTEEYIFGRESEGRKWIYEVTFSSRQFKDELIANGT